MELVEAVTATKKYSKWKQGRHSQQQKIDWNQRRQSQQQKINWNHRRQSQQQKKGKSES